MNPWGDLNEKYAGICDRLDAVTAAVGNLVAVQSDQIHSVAYREWQPFIIPNAATASANTATVNHNGLIQLGWEGRVNRISVYTGGAASAATVAVYVGAADAINLVDFAAGMLGNSPSRIVADYNSPIVIPSGHGLVVVVANLPGATDQVIVRIEGERRES